MNDFFIWKTGPDIFSIGSFALRWYSLLFALAFWLGLLLMRYFFKKEGKREKDIDRLFTYTFFGTIIGARIGHVLFYTPAYYWRHPLEILYIWEGGLASHGAFLGIIISTFLYSRAAKEQPFLWLLDRMAIGVALAGVLIRVGNFFNSEIIGRVTDAPWAVIFKRIDLHPRHPSQLYEAILCAGIFLFLIYLYGKKSWRKNHGSFLGFTFAAGFIGRFFLEAYKTPQADYEQILGFSTGQWLSVPYLLTGILLLIFAWRPVNKSSKSLKK